MKSSHPSRVRGLKSVLNARLRWRKKVAPLAGAWIEMLFSHPDKDTEYCRTPRGCVD